MRSRSRSTVATLLTKSCFAVVAGSSPTPQSLPPCPTIFAHTYRALERSSPSRRESMSRPDVRGSATAQPDFLRPESRRWSRTQAFPRICRPEKDSSHSRSEEHTSELQSRVDLVCRLLLEEKKRSKQ